MSPQPKEKANPVTISPAESPEDLAAVASLISAYVAWIDIDLTYQNLSHELATLPGKYAPSAGGTLLLARSATSGEAIGCIGVREFRTPECCEMKRLYVAPAGRGSGAGKILVARALEFARNHGYKEVKLDTLPSMGAARKLYRDQGFREIPAYYDTPIEGTIFLGLSIEPN